MGFNDIVDQARKRQTGGFARTGSNLMWLGWQLVKVTVCLVLLVFLLLFVVGLLGALVGA